MYSNYRSVSRHLSVSSVSVFEVYAHRYLIFLCNVVRPGARVSGRRVRAEGRCYDAETRAARPSGVPSVLVTNSLKLHFIHYIGRLVAIMYICMCIKANPPPR